MTAQEDHALKIADLTVGMTEGEARLVRRVYYQSFNPTVLKDRDMAAMRRGATILWEYGRTISSSGFRGIFCRRIDRILPA